MEHRAIVLTFLFRGLPTVILLLACLAAGQAHAACSNPTGNERKIIYNGDYHTYQYCNGTSWVAMGGIEPSSGGGCSSPARAERDIIYDGDYHTYQFCNGTDWMAMGPHSATAPVYTWTHQTAGDSFVAYGNIAGSSDLTKLIASAFSSGNSGGGTSTDSGATWTSRAAVFNWGAFASSADGVKLAAAGHPSYIYTSADSGATWTKQTGSGSRNWSAIASSADGTILVASVDAASGRLYVSTDSGVTWTARGPSTDWLGALAVSADGTKMAATNGYSLYTSTDTGTTWTLQSNADSFAGGLASSSDGTKLAIQVGSNLATSTDGGVTWTQRSAAHNWSAIASSADGTKLAATTYDGDYIYTSTDGGATWTQQTGAGNCGGVAGLGWTSIRSSSDGTKLAAVGYCASGWELWTGVLPSCSNPSGAERDIIYNGDFHTYQFCNGSSWILMH